MIDTETIRILTEAGAVGVALVSLGVVVYVIRTWATTQREYLRVQESMNERVTNHLTDVAQQLGRVGAILSLISQRLSALPPHSK